LNSSKKLPNNEGFQSKLFNNEGESELNRSKSSIKSGQTSKNNFELKSKIFNDSVDDKKSRSILNISPIKKEGSLENISKIENKTLTSNFINEGLKDNKLLEDSKFTEFEK
jgi:hypothetical protein